MSLDSSHTRIRPFLVLGTYLFLTQYGYLAGSIISQDTSTILIQYGPEHYLNLVPEAQIRPFRLNTRVYLSLEIQEGSGYFRGLHNLESQFPQLSEENHPGSGIFGLIHESQGFISENPLTLHDTSHQYLLIQVEQLMSHMVKDYLSGNSINPDHLNSLTRMINAVLYIDDHRIIPVQVVELALTNFLFDLTSLSEQSWVKAPLNYILDILHIDSICYQNNALLVLPPSSPLFGGTSLKFSP